MEMKGASVNIPDVKISLLNKMTMRSYEFRGGAIAGGEAADMALEQFHILHFLIHHKLQYIYPWPPMEQIKTSQILR